MSQAGITKVTGGGGGGLPPISDFIVGPGLTYTTIQSGINAAHAAGGGTVYVRPNGGLPGYVENLTLYADVSVIGAVSETINNYTAPGQFVYINGTHTPPDTGAICFQNVYLAGAGGGVGDIFSSASVSAAFDLYLTDVQYSCANLINLPNTTALGANGYVFERVTGTSSVSILNAPANAGVAAFYPTDCWFNSSAALILNGIVVAIFENTVITGGIDTSTAAGGILYFWNSRTSAGPITIGAALTGCDFWNSSLTYTGGVALTFNGTGCTVRDCVINSDPLGNAIGGAGTGLEVSNVIYPSGASTTIAAALYPLTITNTSTTSGIVQAGNGLQVKTGGAVDKIGTAVLGTTGANAVTVVNADVTANSIILASVKTLGTVVTPQALLVAPGAGSFVITSAAAADTSTVMYMIINPY